MKALKGFTLIELLVTIAIAAIVVTMGIPSFSNAITNSRLTTKANELLTSLNLARSEAIKRGMQVTIRRKGSTSKHWEAGWDVFVDTDGSNSFNDDGDANLCETNTDGLLDPDGSPKEDGSLKEDCLLRTYEALPAGFTLVTGGSTASNYIAFLPTGLSKGNAGDTFHLCHDNDVSSSKEITLNPVGRAYVKSPGTSCS